MSEGWQDSVRFLQYFRTLQALWPTLKTMPCASHWKASHESQRHSQHETGSCFLSGNSCEISTSNHLKTDIYLQLNSKVLTSVKSFIPMLHTYCITIFISLQNSFFFFLHVWHIKGKKILSTETDKGGHQNSKLNLLTK